MAMLRGRLTDRRQHRGPGDRRQGRRQSLAELVDLVNIKLGHRGLPAGPRGQRQRPPVLVRRHDQRASTTCPRASTCRRARLLVPHGRHRASSGATASRSRRSAEKPVLAHHFLDYMLQPENAVANFGYTGYQPPQKSLDPASLVKDEYVAENLASTVVRPEEYADGSADPADQRGRRGGLERPPGRSSRPASERNARGRGRPLPPPSADGAASRRARSSGCGRSWRCRARCGCSCSSRSRSTRSRRSLSAGSTRSSGHPPRSGTRATGTPRPSSTRCQDCSTARLRDVFVRTGVYVLSALVLCILIGYPVAYYIARYGGRQRGLLLALILAPWWINYITRMLAWINLLQRRRLRQPGAARAAPT